MALQIVYTGLLINPNRREQQQCCKCLYVMCQHQDTISMLMVFCKLELPSKGSNKDIYNSKSHANVCECFLWLLAISHAALSYIVTPLFDPCSFVQALMQTAAGLGPWTLPAWMTLHTPARLWRTPLPHHMQHHVVSQTSIQLTPQSILSLNHIQTVWLWWVVLPPVARLLL